jgi:hypothetical protein
MTYSKGKKFTSQKDHFPTQGQKKDKRKMPFLKQSYMSFASFFGQNHRTLLGVSILRPEQPAVIILF